MYLLIWVFINIFIQSYSFKRDQESLKQPCSSNPLNAILFFFFYLVMLKMIQLSLFDLSGLDPPANIYIKRIKCTKCAKYHSVCLRRLGGHGQFQAVFNSYIYIQTKNFLYRYSQENVQKSEINSHGISIRIYELSSLFWSQIGFFVQVSR